MVCFSVLYDHDINDANNHNTGVVVAMIILVIIIVVAMIIIVIIIAITMIVILVMIIITIMTPERGPQTGSYFARSAEKILRCYCARSAEKILRFSFARSAQKNGISLRAKRGENF